MLVSLKCAKEKKEETQERINRLRAQEEKIAKERVDRFREEEERRCREKVHWFEL